MSSPQQSDAPHLAALHLHLRDENRRLRALLDAAQAQTAALLPIVDDLPLLRQLLRCSTAADDGGGNATEGGRHGSGGMSAPAPSLVQAQHARQALAEAHGALLDMVQMERAKAEALKASLVAIRQDAQRVNVVCVGLHAAILSGRL